MNQQEYLELIEKHPNLTTEGFGATEGNFALRRNELKGQLENFELCVEWLDKNPHLEGRRNAHYWKDRVQDDYKPSHPGYFHIPRGVFILASLYRGLTAENMTGSTDAWISVTE